jgi:hypothetical protein
MLIRPIVILLSLLLGIFPNQAQVYQALQAPPVSIPTPNADGLGVFGKTQVSLFTGSPQITVPIDNINDGVINVPIQLQYNSQGFRPDVHPGWTGVNWSLSAGGVITRQVNDLPDEFDYNYDNFRKVGFYFTYATLNVSNWNTVGYMKDTYLRYKDSEPDEFNFNVMGLSGTFYFDHTGKWVVKSNKKIKVSISATTPFLDIPITPGDHWESAAQYYTTLGNLKKYPRSFAGFTLTTEDGTQYIFGNNTNAIEYNLNFFNQEDDFWKAVSWYLTKIKTPAGREVTFNYESDRGTNPVFICALFESISQRNVSVSTTSSISFNPFKYLFNSAPLNSACGSSGSLPNYGTYGGELISPVYLRSIETDLIKAEFTRQYTNELRYNPALIQNNFRTPTGECPAPFAFYVFPYLESNLVEVNTYCNKNQDIPIDDIQGIEDPQINKNRLDDNLAKMKWSKLTRIEIKVKTESNFITQRSYDFSYIDNRSQRLMLTSLQKSASDNSKQGKYIFDYNDYNSLPGYLSRQTDHWGFYNGTISNFTYNLESYYNSRQPLLTHTLKGTLKKITYPTGGFSEFIYELNDYSKSVQAQRDLPLVNYDARQSAGGLRIRKIRSFDGHIYLADKEYFYVSNYKNFPSEPINSSGILNTQILYGREDYQMKSTSSPTVNITAQIFSSNSIITNSQDPSVSYSEVAEVTTGQGYTIHKFNNYDNGYMDERFEATINEVQTPYVQYNSKSLERGQLSEESVYNNENHILTKKKLTYIKLNNDFVRTIKVTGFVPCAGVSADYLLEGVAYKIYTYLYELEKEESFVYNQNDETKFIKNTTIYDYNALGQPKAVRMIENGNKEKISYYKYVSDYDLSIATDACFNDYLQCRDQCLDDNNFRDQYGICVAGCNTVKNNCLNSIKNGADEMSKAIITMQEKNIIAPVIEERVAVKFFGDEKIIAGKINFYKVFAQNQVLPSKVIASESNAPVAYFNFSVVDASTHFSYNTQFYKNWSVIFDGYDVKGNLQEYHKNNDISTAYIWGYQNTYPVIEVKNVPLSQVEAALDPTLLQYLRAIPSDQDIQAAHSALKNAFSKGMVSAFTYKPGVGLSSAIDPSGKTVFYVYDTLGRLKLIKDMDGNIIKQYQYNYTLSE